MTRSAAVRSKGVVLLFMLIHCLLLLPLCACVRACVRACVCVCVFGPFCAVLIVLSIFAIMSLGKRVLVALL